MSVQSPEFKYVTEEAFREWRSPSTNFRLPDAIPMSRFLYELCWDVVKWDLSLQSFRAALDSVVFAGKGSREEWASVLPDVVALMGHDVPSCSAVYGREGLEPCHGKETVARWAKCSSTHLLTR